MTKTHHLCPKCDVLQEVSCFQKGRGWCRSCRTQKEKERRAATGVKPKVMSYLSGGHKFCVDCKTMQPEANFQKASRGTGGLSAYCKPCARLRFKPEKSSVRAATAAYRERHPERWKASHRLHQFKRREAQEAASDGTVSDEVLKALYATQHCYYCHLEVTMKFRTVDHKTPLIRGGLHSAVNLVMACRPCNTSKGAKTEEEFKEYLNGL